MSSEPMTHNCDKRCFVCERGYDTFSHVHIQPLAAYPHTADYDGPELVICIPCIAELATAMARPIIAYNQGGCVFDQWGRKSKQKARGGGGGGTQAPPWLKDLLDEMERQMGSGDDIA